MIKKKIKGNKKVAIKMIKSNINKIIDEKNKKEDYIKLKWLYSKKDADIAKKK